MPVPTETLWIMEPHTRAKHEILRRYLGAWFGIMGRTNPRIVYFDGFSGPGRYKGGEEGSPLISLKLALEHHSKNNLREGTFVFIEERKDRVEHLINEINCLAIPQSFHVNVQQNQFEDTLANILDHLDKTGAKIAPTFAFIDPFGFKGAPYKLVKRLLNNSKTEVFINIMADSINRFLDHPDQQITQHITDLFGTPKVLQVIQGNGDRIKQLRELYQKQLEDCAKFVRYFEMRDDNNRPIYYLFFATNNRLGHAKMKVAFWKVDRSTGFRFSDATNPDQLVLFEMDPSAEIAHDLVKKYRGQQVSVAIIKTYIEDETPYIESHLKKALRVLEDQGELCAEPCKQNGEKRRKHTFSDDVVLAFQPLN